MKILFKNAKILDFKAPSKFSYNDVLVDDSIITYIGKNCKQKPDKVVDVEGNILMPGFVNAHTHLAMSLLRGLKDDVKLQDWLFDYIIPAENNYKQNDIYWGTMLGIAEAVKSGITCCEDMYLNVEESVKAFNVAGMRGKINVGFNKVGDASIPNYLNHILTNFSNDLVKPIASIHSIYGTTEEEQEKIVSFANEHNLQIGLHLSETLKEVGDCTVKYDLTPPQYAEKMGIFDRDCTIYHCVHADKDDLQIIADYKVNVVTCPSSNIKLASGIAPIHAMQNLGLNIAIGTDGCASNNRLDMFKEMFLVSTLSKVNIHDASVVSAEDVLKMATINGAKALGFDNVGEIKIGNKADIILVNNKGTHFFPNKNDVSHLVYSAMPSDVYLTMVNGKILYENGKLNIGESEENINKKCYEIFKRITNNGNNTTTN